MHANSNHLFPLRLCILIGEQTHNVRIEHLDKLYRLRGMTGVRKVRVTRLASLATSHFEILARDRAIRLLIEAQLGPARHSYITPRLWEFELTLEYEDQGPGMTEERPAPIVDLSDDPDLGRVIRVFPRPRVFARENE